MSALATVTWNPAIDRVFAVDRVRPEAKLRATDERRFPGGGGLNVARVASRLGSDPVALWSRGGATGERLAGLLDDEELRHRPVGIAGTIRENVIVRAEDHGERYRFVLPGPELQPDDLSAWEEALRDLEPPPDLLVLSGSLPPGASAEWQAERIAELPRSVRVVLDTKADALRAALEAGVWLVKPNVRELGEAVERDLDGDEEVEAAAREILDRGGARAVLVSLGRAGALLVTGGGARHIRAPQVRPASKVGAGDSMVGGLVHALADGWELEDAAVFGVAAGAAAVLTPGTELCRIEDVRRLYGRMTDGERETGRGSADG